MGTYGLEKIGITNIKSVYRNASPAVLVEEALRRHEGCLSDTGALFIDTGKFKGRSPKDKFIVDTEGIHDLIAWDDINVPVSRHIFDAIKAKNEALATAAQKLGEKVYAKQQAEAAAAGAGGGLRGPGRGDGQGRWP